MDIAMVNAQREIKITKLFGEFGKRILAFVRTRIDDVDEAEDIAQDVWLQLSKQTDLDSIQHVPSWLFTTARNRVTDYYRKKRPVRMTTKGSNGEEGDEYNESEEYSFNLWAGSNLPDVELESKEFWDELNKALAALPEEQRDVFVAHELYGVPFNQMVEEWNVPLNTLLGRKRYAVEKLRKHFEHYI